MSTITLKLYEASTVASSSGVTTVALVNKKATVTCAAPTDSQQTIIRLWRRGGSATAGWAFVGEYPISQLTPVGGPYLLTDNVADASLGSFVLLDNDPPVTSVSATGISLPYIWGPFNGIILGCGDPSRPESVYWSKPGNADAWPSGNWVVVSTAGEVLLGGCVYNNRVFTFSRERMFELISGLVSATGFQGFPTPCARGLISPWGLAVADYIYFVAKDGVYRTAGAQEESLVENSIKPLFPTQDSPGESVNGYEAVDLSQVNDIRLAYHNNEIWFRYKGIDTGDIFWLIYDCLKLRWRAAEYNPDLLDVYSEPGTASSLLLSDSNGSLYSAGATTDNGTNITCNVRTGAHDQSMPLTQKEYGSVLFDIDPGGATAQLPITITPLINGETVTESALTITGSGRQAVPLDLGDIMAYNIEFDVAFTRNAAINPILYGLDVLWREEPTAVNHWEVRETSHGLLGWQHIRDAYVALRSTATVTLTMTFDSTTTQTYTLTSTNGNRIKQYLPFNSNKFKMVRYQFDSTAPFRLYIEDSVVFCRSWGSNGPYSPVKPFGGEITLAGAALASAVEGGV